MSDVLRALENALGKRVRRDEATRLAHRRDSWSLAELIEYRGETGPPPLAVVEPESTEEVAEVLRLCRAKHCPVVTFGGGSGVCGGIRTHGDEVVLSTRRLDGLVSLDDEDLLARFRAGTMGSEAERRVREMGLTIGHWPQSIDLSTVGGWVATRASGQYSTGYGSIEDLVFALEVVLPDGRVLHTRETPRASAGPDLRQLFLGSEGTLGVVTEVSFSLRPLPPAEVHQAFHFESLPAALPALRRMLRAGWRPPVVRLYDAIESPRHFPDECPPGRAMLLLLHEGPEAAVAAEAEACAVLCCEGGAAKADSRAVAHWLAKRNQVPGFRPFIEKGIMVDTIEIASTWSRLAAVYEGALASLSQVPGLLAASAHASHAYRSGANLYFTFAVRPSERERMGEAYEECWRRTLEATLAAGGGIAHHHGIGRVRRDFLAREVGETGVAVLRAIKRALDPDDLLNPGILLPRAGGE